MNSFIQYKSRYALAILYGIGCCFAILACAQQNKETVASPPGYDLSAPKKHKLPDALLEISGIAFEGGNPATIYAQQDEEGKVYSLSLGNKQHRETKFAKNGDYEDIAIAKGRIIMLKSNGHLYTFPLAETHKEKATGVVESKSLLGKGEYEGMYADQQRGLIYVLCKDCKSDKKQDFTSGYILALAADGSLKSAGQFRINLSKLDQLAGRKKGVFHPSALAKHPITGQWYILSSVNKVLVITDNNWNLKAAYHLSANVFNQPEGIAFDKNGNLYISNEGSDTQYGNILEFKYKQAQR